MAVTPSQMREGIALGLVALEAVMRCFVRINCLTR